VAVVLGRLDSVCASTLLLPRNSKVWQEKASRAKGMEQFETQTLFERQSELYKKKTKEKRRLMSHTKDSFTYHGFGIAAY